MNVVSFKQRKGEKEKQDEERSLSIIIPSDLYYYFCLPHISKPIDIVLPPFSLSYAFLFLSPSPFSFPHFRAVGETPHHTVNILLRDQKAIANSSDKINEIRYDLGQATMAKEVEFLFFDGGEAALYEDLPGQLKFKDAKRLLDSVVHGGVVKWDVLPRGNLDDLLRCDATQKRSRAWKIAMSGSRAAIKSKYMLPDQLLCVHICALCQKS